MVQKIYEIFKKCFNNNTIGYEEFCNKLDLNDAMSVYEKTIKNLNTSTKNNFTSM